MGVTAAIIAGGASLLGAGISYLGSSGGPSYPSPPKMYKLPVGEATKTMEDYETQRMAASIGAWKERFPLLAKGGAAQIADIRANQLGKISKTVSGTLKASGLPEQGGGFGASGGDTWTPEARAMDIGLSPVALSQRTSQAVQRQIAMNPEWTNKISGGTLASMMANANANQNAFTGALGGIKSAMYRTGAAQGATNTAALLGLPLGAAKAYTGVSMMTSDPWNVGTYQQPWAAPTAPTTPAAPAAPISTGIQTGASTGGGSGGWYSNAAPGMAGYEPAGSMSGPGGSSYVGAVPPAYDYGNLYIPGSGF
jgi:hypothetical protein